MTAVPVDSVVQTAEQGPTVVLGVVVLMLTVMIGYQIRTARRTGRNEELGLQIKDLTEKVNRAVNNVGPDQDSLIELVQRVTADVRDLKDQQREFDTKGWGALPTDIGDAAHLTETVRELQAGLRDIRRRLDRLEAD